jgi:hypothetical protein
LFSHDPAALLSRLYLENSGTPPAYNIQPNLQIQDYEAFPALRNQTLDVGTIEQLHGAANGMSTPPPGLSPFAPFMPGGNGSRPQSRPSSRHHSRAATPSAPQVDDNEAFPSLSSVGSAKGGKRHHGKRGGHGHKENAGPNSLAELVRMSPSPSPAVPRRGLKNAKSFNGTRENSTAAQAIPAPKHIPWLETGEVANQAYLKARQEAFKHGGLRNKFLQR